VEGWISPLIRRIFCRCWVFREGRREGGREGGRFFKLGEEKKEGREGMRVGRFSKQEEEKEKGEREGGREEFFQ